MLHFMWRRFDDDWDEFAEGVMIVANRNIQHDMFVNAFATCLRQLCPMFHVRHYHDEVYAYCPLVHLTDETWAPKDMPRNLYVCGGRDLLSISESNTTLAEIGLCPFDPQSMYIGHQFTGHEYLWEECGTRFLNVLQSTARRYGIRLVVIPTVTGHRCVNVGPYMASAKRLDNWYADHGFVSCLHQRLIGIRYPKDIAVNFTTSSVLEYR